MNYHCLPPGHGGVIQFCLRRTIYYERWSQEGILLDCPPKPLSQHREGIGREWTDKTTLISVQGPRYNLHYLKPQDRGQSALGMQAAAPGRQVLTAELRLSLLHMLLMTFKPEKVVTDWFDL